MEVNMKNIRSSNNFITYQNPETGVTQVFIYEDEEKKQMFQNLENFRKSYEENFFSNIVIYWDGRKVYYSIPHKKYLYNLSNKLCYDLN